MDVGDLGVLVTSPIAFTGYSQERTKDLTAFISSGIMREDAVLRNWMTSAMGSGGGGTLLTKPTWNDLLFDTADAETAVAGLERIGSDAQSPLYTPSFGTAFPTPQFITAHVEQAVRVERNNHWAVAALAESFSGASPDIITNIGNLTAAYWARRLQKMVLAILAGVVASDIAAPTGGSTHTAGDLLFDVSGSAFINGVTSFTAESLYDALQTMADADGQITNLAVHSVVRNRMRKNDLIDFLKDSEGNYTIESFKGLRLTVDDGMPKTGQVYDSYLFGPGFLQYATVAPKNATTMVWRDEAGNGAGSTELWNRVGWCVHPMGHKYVTATDQSNAGPTNATFRTATSWVRSAQTRKNIPFAVLRTREA